MPVDAAARVLGVPVGTVRRWIRDGAPVARRGRRGRGHAVLVDPEAVTRWREAVEQGECAAVLAELEHAIPSLVADAALQVLAAAPPTGTGAERRLLHAAVDATARAIADALNRKLHKSIEIGRI